MSNTTLKEREIYRRSHTKAQELNKQTGKEHLTAQTKQYIYLTLCSGRSTSGLRSPQAPPKYNSPDNCSSSKKPSQKPQGRRKVKPMTSLRGRNGSGQYVLQCPFFLNLPLCSPRIGPAVCPTPPRGALLPSYSSPCTSSRPAGSAALLVLSQEEPP